MAALSETSRPNSPDLARAGVTIDSTIAAVMNSTDARLISPSPPSDELNHSYGRRRESVPGSVHRGEVAVPVGHVGGEGFGQDHGAVGLLVVLQQRDQRPADCAERPVHRVDGTIPVGKPNSGFRPASLEVGGVRRRGHLAVLALAREPRLKVELPGKYREVTST